MMVMKCLMGMNYSSTYLFWSHQAADFETGVCSFWSFASERFAAYHSVSATVHDVGVSCIQHMKVLLVNTLRKVLVVSWGFS